MPLYHVQDGDRPMFIIAADFETALAQWRCQILIENDDEQSCIEGAPDGIQCITDDDAEIMNDGILRRDFLASIRPPAPTSTDKNDVPY